MAGMIPSDKGRERRDGIGARHPRQFSGPPRQRKRLAVRPDALGAGGGAASRFWGDAVDSGEKTPVSRYGMPGLMYV